MSMSRFRLVIMTACGILVGTLMLSPGTAQAVGRRGAFGVAAIFRDNVDFGAQVRWDRPKGDNISFVPQIGYFFNDSILDLDFDIHFTVNESEAAKIYALGGADLVSDFNDVTELGANLGAGVSKDLTSSLNGFVEGKWVISDLDGFALQLGLHF